MKHARPNALSHSTIVHWRSMLGSIGLALALGLSVMLLLMRPAHATSGAVTNCTNDTELTQLLGGGGSITFNCNHVNDPATIVLSAQKFITRPTSIDGGEVITLSGAGVSRIFSVPVGSQLTLANISLINGAPSNGHGGAILNAGQLIASNVLFYNNVATGTVWVGGGAIRTIGALTVTDSRFVSNTAKGVGGAIWIDDTSGLVPVFISATTFYSNTSLDWGGALDNDGGNPLIVINSVFHDNRSLTAGAGALDSDSLGPLQISGSSFYHNAGQDCCGAIYDNGPITVTNSAIYGNWSRGGAGGIEAGRPAVFSNVAIYSNTTIGNGGGLFAYSNTTLSNVQIYSNVAAQGGGGIYNSQFSNSVLHLINSAVHDNVAAGSAGIENNGTLIMTGAQIYRNTATAGYAGGIGSFGTGLYLYNVDIYSNTVIGANGIGGGIDHESGIVNPAYLDRVRIYGNTIISGFSGGSGGGFSVFENGSVLTLTDSSVFGNSVGANGAGGGIHAGRGTTVTVMNSAVYNNAVPNGFGGGLNTGDSFGGAKFELVNSTLANNSALRGGGLRNFVSASPVVMTNATIYSNSASIGGNISGTAKLINTIVGGSANNCANGVTSLGHNLESGNSCGLSAIGDITNRNPLLFPLANYGGPTWSMLPMPGSPVINHGSNAVCPPTDQRGIPRPNGGVCDIGAVEFNLAQSIYLPLVLKNF